MSSRDIHTGRNNRLRKILLLTAGIFSSSILWAQAPKSSSISNPFVVVMVVIMLVLALIIGLLGYVVLGTADLYLQKYKKEQATAEDEKKSQPATIVASVVALLLIGLTASAQDTEATSAAITNRVNISDTAFYLMTGVIFVELLVIGALLYNLRVLLEIRSKKKLVVAQPTGKPVVSWWEKFNKFKPVEQEFTIDTGHDYDGIRELNNRLPPWWLYGFYCTIIFAVVYLWRFHVSHSAPLSGEEYQLAVTEAAVKREAYLKKAANSVDENTVKLLTDAGDLAAGQKVFQTACFACHGKQGEGGVGPNLTDNYWLHGGEVSEIFKTIKYGVAEKGMKSWKDDYSPAQIAQIASYIKSLQGTNPPNGKAPQGNPESSN